MNAREVHPPAKCRECHRNGLGELSRIGSELLKVTTIHVVKAWPQTAPEQRVSKSRGAVLTLRKAYQRSVEPIFVVEIAISMEVGDQVGTAAESSEERLAFAECLKVLRRAVCGHGANESRM